MKTAAVHVPQSIFSQSLTDDIIHTALNSPIASELKTTAVNSIVERYLEDLEALSQLNHYLENDHFKTLFDKQQTRARSHEQNLLFKPEHHCNTDELYHQLAIFYSMFLLNTYLTNNTKYFAYPFYRQFSNRQFPLLVNFLNQFASVLARFQIQLTNLFQTR